MPLRQFYWECVRRALHSAYGAAAGIGLIVSLFASLSLYVDPETDWHMDLLIWALPVAVFLVLLWLGLVPAAHSIYRELEGKTKLQALPPDDSERRQAILNQINNFIQEGSGLTRNLRAIPMLSTKQQLPPLEVQVNRWVEELNQFVGLNYPQFSAQLMNDAGLPEEADVFLASRVRERITFVSRRVMRLNEMRKEISAGSVLLPPAEPTEPLGTADGASPDEVADNDSS